MTPAQASATLTLLGYVPAWSIGTACVWHAQHELALAVVNSGVQGSKHVFCASRRRSDVKFFSEPAQLSDETLVWLAQAAMLDMEPGDIFLPQQMIRWRK
jgi:hypothetical protein